MASLVPGTLRSLGVPRRTIPAALVLAALLFTEWQTTHRGAAIAVDLVLFAAFVLVAPASWRALSRRGLPGQAGYVAIGVVVVGVLAVGLPRALGLAGTYVADPASMGVVLALFLVGGWGLGRDIDLEEGVAAERGRAAALALSAERAELLALRAHLDPHFLFNALNAIAEWCREDPVVAEGAILRLATMLRAILEGVRRPSWPLSAEISLCSELFALYEIRDKDRYRFLLDAPDPVPEALVPPMLFLPLVENAVTHGPAAGHRGEVVVRLRGEGDGIELRIVNPGAYTGRREGGQGIALVERRLALAYEGRATLDLRAEGGTTVTTARLPRRPLHEEVLSR
jgi:hypothetical protein